MNTDRDFLELETEVSEMETKLYDNPDYVIDADDFGQEFYDIVDKLYEMNNFLEYGSASHTKRYDAIRQRLLKIKEDTAVYDNGHLRDLYKNKDNYRSTEDDILDDMYPDGDDDQ